MLNTTEHEIIQLLMKTNMVKIKTSIAFKFSDGVFVMLTNVKMQTFVGILTFMSMINFMFSRVEHGKKFYNLETRTIVLELQEKLAFSKNRTMERLLLGRKENIK